MPSQQNNASIKFLIAKWCLVSAFLFSLVFLPFSVFGNASTFVNDGFEAYELGALNSQGEWTTTSAITPVVDDTEANTGAKSLYWNKTYETIYYARILDKTINVGSQAFYFYHNGSINGTSASSLFQVWHQNYYAEKPLISFSYGYFEGWEEKYYFVYDDENNQAVYLKSGNQIAEIELEVWHSIYVEWDTGRGVNGEWRLFWNDELIIDWEGFNYRDAPNKTPTTLSVASYRMDYWHDDFSVDIPEPDVRVWGISPDSGTEITDLDTEFQFGWEDLDWFDGLLISFYNKKTRIHTNAKRYDTDVIGFNGTKILNLQDFLFEKNADWYFNAIAFVEVPETYEGLYLTGRYITEYTYNVVSPEYFLTINIEGFTTIFEMEDWETWYGEHAEQFETPTLLFGRVATLFAPTFENIGEFGQRILDYFEVDKAYSRGYELGLAIPIFSYYLTSVEVFYGGLPVIKLFLMTLILMVGIFLFKIVMKFIPFFG